MPDDKPHLIIFFPNTTAAVCGAHGQIQKYQLGDHHDTIAALAADGIDWRTIPERLGSPSLNRAVDPQRRPAP